MGYLALQKNFKNTKVFTKKNTFETDLFTNHSRKKLIIMKGLIRVSNKPL